MNHWKTDARKPDIWWLLLSIDSYNTAPELCFSNVGQSHLKKKWRLFYFLFYVQYSPLLSRLQGQGIWKKQKKINKKTKHGRAEARDTEEMEQVKIRGGGGRQEIPFVFMKTVWLRLTPWQSLLLRAHGNYHADPSLSFILQQVWPKY